jgi:hypothetical protein
VTRLLVLCTALLFIALFAFLTISVIVREGLSLAGLLSIFILVLFSIGIVGALRNPPGS